MNDRRQLVLFFSGDVMTGRGVDQILPNPGNPTLHESYVKDARDYVRLAERAGKPVPRPVDFRYIWSEAFDAWQTHDPDLKIVNLETSVTTSDDHWPGKGIHYRMHPKNVPCLTEAELDCCALANNHIMDWGRAGLDETLLALEHAGISAVGAGRSLDQARTPARFTVPGKADVLVFAVADTSSGVPPAWQAGPDRPGVYLLTGLGEPAADRIAEDIADSRRPEDIVVLSIHWGGNWGFRIPIEQRRFAHRLIDAGIVDIVHGHSSHHPKAIERYRSKVILYGCGDFITDYEGIGGNEIYRSWLSPMYFVSIDPTTKRVEELEIEVLRLRRFGLTRARRQDRRWLRHKLNEFGAEFACFREGEGRSLVTEPCPSSPAGGTHA